MLRLDSVFISEEDCSIPDGEIVVPSVVDVVKWAVVSVSVK